MPIAVLIVNYISVVGDQRHTGLSKLLHRVFHRLDTRIHSMFHSSVRSLEGLDRPLPLPERTLRFVVSAPWVEMRSAARLWQNPSSIVVLSCSHLEATCKVVLPSCSIILSRIVSV